MCTRLMVVRDFMPQGRSAPTLMVCQYLQPVSKWLAMASSRHYYADVCCAGKRPREGDSDEDPRAGPSKKPGACISLPAPDT